MLFFVSPLSQTVWNIEHRGQRVSFVGWCVPAPPSIVLPTSLLTRLPYFLPATCLPACLSVVSPHNLSPNMYVCTCVSSFQVLKLKEMLSRGIGVHHGGLLPILKASSPRPHPHPFYAACVSAKYIRERTTKRYTYFEVYLYTYFEVYLYCTSKYTYTRQTGTHTSSIPVHTCVP